MQDDLDPVADLGAQLRPRHHAVVAPRLDELARLRLPVEDRCGQLPLLRPVGEDRRLQQDAALSLGLGREGGRPRGIVVAHLFGVIVCDRLRASPSRRSRRCRVMPASACPGTEQRNASPPAGIVTVPLAVWCGIGGDHRAIVEGQVVQDPAVIDEVHGVFAGLGDRHRRRLEAQVEGVDLDHPCRTARRGGQRRRVVRPAGGADAKHDGGQQQGAGKQGSHAGKGGEVGESASHRSPRSDLSATRCGSGAPGGRAERPGSARAIGNGATTARSKVRAGGASPGGCRRPDVIGPCCTSSRRPRAAGRGPDQARGHGRICRRGWRPSARSRRLPGGPPPRWRRWSPPSGRARRDRPLRRS